VLPPLEYLSWAIENYHSVRYDLASSGLKSVPPEEITPGGEWLGAACDATAPGRWVEAIARRMGVPVDCTAATLGTTHGIWTTYAAVLSAGDEVVVESPAYEPLVRAAQGLGARVVHFDREPSRGAPVDPAAIERAMTDRTRMVVVSNLHNPTGAYVDDATIGEVAKVTRRRGALLMVDEVYRDLVDAEAGRSPSAFHLGPGIVVTSSLTKVYGLGWIRAGWVLAPKEIAARVRDATLHSVGGISPATASMGLAALAHMKEVYARSVAARANDAEAAARVRAFVDARPHLSWRQERGSIFGFVMDARGKDLRPTIERAVREQQVIVAPGVFFGVPSAFRLRYGAIDLGVLDEGLRRLGAVLDEGA
jgi:aspartate/methionine/tyrosine aminotransferase